MQVSNRVAGQGLVEYGLILVLIMVVCVGILTVSGQTISEVWYNQIIQRLP
ncbi:MAG: Flp family type IVb pilin [Oscillochloris sp.]|nr:Flp family type IVb pilin [Oscillochloris sp.]